MLSVSKQLYDFFVGKILRPTKRRMSNYRKVSSSSTVVESRSEFYKDSSSSLFPSHTVELLKSRLTYFQMIFNGAELDTGKVIFMNFYSSFLCSKETADFPWDHYYVWLLIFRF